MGKPIKYLQAEANKINENIKIFGRHEAFIEIMYQCDNYTHSNFEAIYVKCLLNESGKIDYEATINDELGKLWLNKFEKGTKELEETIENYDTYMSISEKLEDVLKAFNKLPHRFRDNLRTNNMHIY